LLVFETAVAINIADIAQQTRETVRVKNPSGM